MAEYEAGAAYGRRAHAVVHRMREQWMAEAVAAGMSYEGARRALRRAVAMAFPCVVLLSAGFGFIVGWFVHG